MTFLNSKFLGIGDFYAEITKIFLLKRPYGFSQTFGQLLSSILGYFLIKHSPVFPVGWIVDLSYGIVLDRALDVLPNSLGYCFDGLFLIFPVGRYSKIKAPGHNQVIFPGQQ